MEPFVTTQTVRCEVPVIFPGTRITDCPWTNTSYLPFWAAALQSTKPASDALIAVIFAELLRFQAVARKWKRQLEPSKCFAIWFKTMEWTRYSFTTTIFSCARITLVNSLTVSPHSRLVGGARAEPTSLLNMGMPLWKPFAEPAAP